MIRVLDCNFFLVIFCCFILNLWTSCITVTETDARPYSGKENNVPVLQKFLINERWAKMKDGLCDVVKTVACADVGTSLRIMCKSNLIFLNIFIYWDVCVFVAVWVISNYTWFLSCSFHNWSEYCSYTYGYHDTPLLLPSHALTHCPKNFLRCRFSNVLTLVVNFRNSHFVRFIAEMD
jgi:hypothetical protein